MTVPPSISSCARSSVTFIILLAKGPGAKAFTVMLRWPEGWGGEEGREGREGGREEIKRLSLSSSSSFLIVCADAHASISDQKIKKGRQKRM